MSAVQPCAGQMVTPSRCMSAAHVTQQLCANPVPWHWLRCEINMIVATC